MQVLRDEQVASFHRDGYVMMADAVTPEDLAALKEVFADWIADSRSHGGPWGTTVDGRARFDVEPGHSVWPRRAAGRQRAAGIRADLHAARTRRA